MAAAGISAVAAAVGSSTARTRSGIATRIFVRAGIELSVGVEVAHNFRFCGGVVSTDWRATGTLESFAVIVI